MHSDYRRVIARNRRRQIFKRILAVLCCIVVFCTTYALILPAITMENKALCGIAEHTHTEDCYETQSGKMQICGQQEQEGHVHGESCYVPGETEAPTVHSHNSDCYCQGALICETEADHIHAAECFTEQTICEAADEAHIHDDTCVERILDCVVEEYHSHSASCYEWTVSCGMEEGQPEAAESAEPVLVCTEPVAEAHTHDDSCFGEVQTGFVTVCGNMEENHSHNSDCYKLVCAMPEHEHTLICFSDPEADVETAGVWEATFADVALTGNNAEDLVAIAQSQLGYTESTRNYHVREDNTLQGYTRYGAWFGDPYGRWDAMFVSFCLRYAGVEGMPGGDSVSALQSGLISAGLYCSAKETKAQKGNLIFLDTDADGTSDRVGIVVQVQEAQEHTGDSVKTIEGDVSGSVRYQYYTPDAAQILGYGLLPGQQRIPAASDAEAEEVIPDSALEILVCGTAAYTHGDSCYDTDGTLLCEKQEHTHTIDCAATSSPVGYADGGSMMRMMNASRTGGNIQYHTNIKPLLTGVAIYDSNNVLVYESEHQSGSGTVTLGENCRIVISFAENESNQFQAGNNDVLVYQIPENLTAEMVSDGVIKNRNNVIIATYHIDNGNLSIVPVLVNGKNFFGEFNNVTLSIEFDAEVTGSTSSEQTNIDFNGNYKVTINKVEDPKIDAKKQQLLYDPDTQTITYQCSATAYGGTVPITTISDWWWPSSVSVVEGSLQLKDKDGNNIDLSSWTMESGESMFTLTPNNPVILAHNESITLSYQVKVNESIAENFDFNNAFYVYSYNNGQKLEDTDTITTPIVVTNVEKNGVQEKETVDGVEIPVLKWTVNIDNPDLEIIQISDQLGPGQQFCTHQPITVRAMNMDGTYTTQTIAWDHVERNDANNQFELALPSLIFTEGKNEYKAYELIYCSHFELNAENTGLQVFDNTVTTNVMIGNKPTVGTSSVGVLGVPPAINKAAQSDDEWITFTIDCNIPGALYNQSNVLVYDSLSTWNNGVGYYFQQNPDSMQITVTPEGGEAYELVRYGNQESAENTYLLVENGQDFTVYFNTKEPVPATSVWKCSENATLTISYRVSRDAPMLDDSWNGNPTGETMQDFLDSTNLPINNYAQLDYAPGYSVNTNVSHRPESQSRPPLSKTAEMEQDGIYTYTVEFRPIDNNSCVFDTQEGTWEYDIQSLRFVDTFDSRMEYVNDSLVVKANAWGDHYETFVYTGGKGPGIEKSGETVTMIVDVKDLIGTLSEWLNGQTLLYGMQVLQDNVRYEISYQLKVKDEVKLSTTEGTLRMDNSISMEWTDRHGSHETPSAHHQVEYDTGILQKGMLAIPDSNMVQFSILVNQNALDLAAGEDSYVLYDIMSSNLILLYDTLTVDVMEKTGGTVKDTLSAAECQFAYDSYENKMTFRLPDNEVLRLQYNCMVDGLGGTNAEIANTVTLLGRSTVQDIESSTFEIEDHQGSADASSESFYLLKQDGYTNAVLPDVTFHLYGDVMPPNYNGGENFVIQHPDHSHIMYHYGSFTTGEDGMAVIQHGQLTSKHLYALVEETPPDGYIAPSEPYLFYMEELEPSASQDIPCLTKGQIVVIKNYPISYELPKTGGPGLQLYTAGGFLLILAAAVLLYNQKKCRKEDYEPF